MKLEITLTDEQAAPFVAALEKLANPIVAVSPAPLPELPSEPALPDPPEGFHPVIIGPLKVIATGAQKQDVACLMVYQKWDKSGWEGSTEGRPYALRIGSEIARLNGFELTLKLGRTYATNSGEIVEMANSSKSGHRFWKGVNPVEWTPCGQALIDGVAQPLSHPDSIKEEIPAELLPLPKLPDGFKEWRARGFGSQSNDTTKHHGEWWVAMMSGHKWQRLYIPERAALGLEDRYYLEAIPADKDPEPAKQRREWEINHDGLSTYPIAIPVPFSQKRIEPGSPVMVREVLPGDPTPEQVEELVRAGVQAIKRLRAFRLVDDELESALQPFTGKEPQ